MQQLFIVEDNVFYASLIKEALDSSDTEVTIFNNGEECLQYLHLEPAVVILDYYLDGQLTGIETLQRIKANNPNIQVIFLTSQANMQVALNSLRFGAFDYIEKNDNAISSLQDAIERIQILENAKPKQSPSVFNIFKKTFA